MTPPLQEQKRTIKSVLRTIFFMDFPWAFLMHMTLQNLNRKKKKAYLKKLDQTFSCIYITVQYFCCSNEEGKSFCNVFENDDGCRPTEMDTTKEDIGEWQSVSGERGKKENDLFVTTGVSSRRGIEKGLRLLCFSDCLSPGQESCRPSSRRIPIYSISLCLCAYLPPPPSHLCMQCQTTLPHSTSPLSLSAAVKSDRLQMCFLTEGKFTTARLQATVYDIAPLQIYWAVIFL